MKSFEKGGDSDETQTETTSGEERPRRSITAFTIEQSEDGEWEESVSEDAELSGSSGTPTSIRDLIKRELLWKHSSVVIRAELSMDEEEPYEDATQMEEEEEKLPDVSVVSRMGWMQSAWLIVWIFCCPPFPTCIINKMAFRPPKSSYTFATDAGLVVKKSKRELYPTVYRIQIKARTLLERKLRRAPRRIGDLEAFYVRSARGNRIACLFGRTPYPPARFTILFAHPNAIDIGQLALFSMARLTDRLRSDVLLFDYSGYGESDGACRERNVYADVEAVLGHLTEERNIPEEKILLMGQSLGTAAVTHAAALPDSKVAGLILVAPFCSAVQVRCSSTHLPFDKFQTANKIQSVLCPTLIVHGLEDEMVSPKHGYALYHLLNNHVRPLWLHRTNHNDIEAQTQYWARLQSFIANDLNTGPLFPAYQARLFRLYHWAAPKLHKDCVEGGRTCVDCREAFLAQVGSLHASCPTLQGAFQILTYFEPQNENRVACSLVAY